MICKLVFYRPQRSWGKVMFLHVSVILFTGGVCHTPPGQTPLADTPRQTPPLGRHPRADPPWADTPWQTPPRTDTPSACWDTVNKRVVRILLECNLVICFCLKEEARRIAAEEEKERLEPRKSRSGEKGETPPRSKSH